MQLISTAVTAGLETIDILIIFLKRPEPILEKEIPLRSLDLQKFPDQPNVQH